MPGKESHSRLMPWTLCPSLEWRVRSFAVVVLRGGNQLVDILLIGWWWGKWESASATFWLQQVWVYVLVGSIQCPSTWGGFSIYRIAQRCCYVYPLRENQDLDPRLHHCFFLSYFILSLTAQHMGSSFPPGIKPAPLAVEAHWTTRKSRDYWLLTVPPLSCTPSLP